MLVVGTWAVQVFGTGLKIQAFTVDPQAFGYKHRLVRVSFREGRDYLLYGPHVDVDLTAEQVRVTRTDKPHEK